MRLPQPPLRLAERCGAASPERLAGFDALIDDLLTTGWWHPDDPLRSHDELGRMLAATLRAALPQEWSFEGKRVLDFGCGIGRVLRHLIDQAPGAELHGCDIDAPSIEWLRSHLSPPLSVTLNGERPPLPFPDGHFDLIYAMSVYTHLTHSWSDWMREHRRLLAPGGFLFASFFGPAAARWLPSGMALPRDPGEAGVVFMLEGADWDAGGPLTLHAPWWIHEHWGRALELVALSPDGLCFPAGSGQGWALMRRRGRPCADSPAVPSGR